MIKIQATPNLVEWALRLKTVVNQELIAEGDAGPNEMVDLCVPYVFAAGTDPEETYGESRLWVKMQSPRMAEPWWFAEGSPIENAMYFGPVASWSAEKLDGE